MLKNIIRIRIVYMRAIILIIGFNLRRYVNVFSFFKLKLSIKKKEIYFCFLIFRVSNINYKT